MIYSAAMLARLAAVGLAAGVFLASAVKHARGVEFSGVNDAKMAWRNPNDRAATVEALSRAGARHVRIMAVRPLDAMADAAAALKTRGISVLVMVPLGQSDFFADGVRPREADPVHYPLRPTSEMDVARFASFWSEVLAALDARGVVPEGVELGNEINISPFEASLPRTVGGLSVDAATLSGQPFAEAYGRALDRYVEALRVVKGSLARRAVPLLLASVVRPEPDWSSANGVTSLDPAFALRMLMDRGAGDLADAFALHLYPQVGAKDEDPDASTARAVEAAFGPLSAVAGAGRSWWITEWGFARAVGRDTGNELPRLRRMRAFANAVEGRPEARAMGPAFLYDFSDDELFRIVGADGPSDPDALLRLSPR